MLEEILKSLGITTLAGSALTLVIAALRPVTRKRFGPAWQYYIWLAVLVTLVLPIRVSLPQTQTADVGLRPISPTLQAQDVRETASVEAGPTDVPATAAQATDAPTGGLTIPLRRAARAYGPQILVAVWLTGAVVSLLWYLGGYASLRRKIRKRSVEIACPELRQYTSRRVRALSCSAVRSPFMAGVFRPVLILPDRPFTDEQLRNVLRHETTHLRRGDIAYKWGAAFVQCVHWFNPAVWYATRQINAECEISCDLSVVANMTREEETGYVDTILSMLSTRTAKAVPLTTGMAGGKKSIKRRLEMMKNKKKTSKIMSGLSAVVAILLLSTTVFASGVLSDLAADDYTIEILNNGEKVELSRKPTVENGEIYVPLREMFEKIGVMAHPDSKIEWNDGRIDLCIAYDADAAVTAEHQSLNGGQGVDVVTILWNHAIEIGKPVIFENTEPNLAGESVLEEKPMSAAPILKGFDTYIPYSYLRELLDRSEWNLNYLVYDKNGHIVLNDAQAVQTSRYEHGTPEYAVDQFFHYFETGDFEGMKRYCTDSCANRFFGDGYCFGMTEAKLVSMDAEWTENMKSSNDFVMQVSVSMTPHKPSVYPEGQTEAAFYLILMRQPDGRYLIDEFATGL